MSAGRDAPAVAVCGGGHGALATAADLGLRGFEVRLALRNRERFATLFETRRLEVGGAGIEGVAELAQVSDDHAAVVAGADLVLVPLPAFAQEDVAARMAPGLRPGQLVSLFPGTFGSWAVADVLRRHGVDGVVVTETATLPYGARARSDASVRLALVAHHLPTGVYPAEATAEAVERLRQAYPVVEPVEDALSAGLLNPNGALHAPLVALNAVPLERGPYDIHREGTTDGVRRVITALDGERIALREALGYRSPHWPLSDYYANRDWFYGPGAFAAVQERSVWRERLGLDHRYVREDVACGLALWSSLGRRLGVPTPLADAFLALFGALTGEDLRAGGRTLERLGLGDVQLETLREWLRRGRP